MLVVTNLRGTILECSPWAEQHLNIEFLMQEYFYEDDAIRVVRILQSCECSWDISIGDSWRGD